MKKCPDCGRLYGEGDEVRVGEEPCGRCEEGVENREERL